MPQVEIQKFQEGLTAYLTDNILAEGWDLPVFDTPPQITDGQKDDDFPRLVIGDIESRDYGGREGDTEELFVRIHTFSATAGFTEARGFQDWMRALLHAQTFPVDGHKLVFFRREDSEIKRDPDRIIHGICDYRGVIEALPTNP